MVKIVCWCCRPLILDQGWPRVVLVFFVQRDRAAGQEDGGLASPAGELEAAVHAL